MRFLHLLPLLCAITHGLPTASNAATADALLAKPAHDWSDRMGSKVGEFRTLFQARNAQKSPGSSTSSLRPPNEKILNKKLDRFEEKHAHEKRGDVGKVNPDGFFAFSESILEKKYSPEELQMARCVIENNLADVSARNAARGDGEEVRAYDPEFMRMAGLTPEDIHPKSRETMLSEQAKKLGLTAEEMELDHLRKRQAGNGGDVMVIPDDLRVCAITDGMTDVVFDAERLEVLALVVEDVRTFTLYLQMYPDAVDPDNIPAPVFPPGFFCRNGTAADTGARGAGDDTGDDAGDDAGDVVGDYGEDAALGKRYMVKHELDFIPRYPVGRPVVKPLQDDNLEVKHVRM